MKVNSINANQRSTSFGALTMDPAAMPKVVFDQLASTPALKKLGKNYDATIEIATFVSKRNRSQEQLGLYIRDIKPKSFLKKLADLFSSKQTSSTILLKTHATTEEDLVKSIAKRDLADILHIRNK